MDIYVALAFIGPIALVLAMRMAGTMFSGWKTNTQGVLLAAIAGIETMDLSFIPSDVGTALTGGAGLAVLMASQFTKRVAKREPGPGY